MVPPSAMTARRRRVRDLAAPLARRSHGARAPLSSLFPPPARTAGEVRVMRAFEGASEWLAGLSPGRCPCWAGPAAYPCGCLAGRHRVRSATEGGRRDTISARAARLSGRGPTEPGPMPA
eukprot:scaffold1517_cov397-Prasinococcus_capsulatus_cf.AAC.9